MKIAALMWGSYSPVIKRAAEITGDTCTVYPTQALEQSPDLVQGALASCRQADVILLYHTSDLFWEAVDKEIARIRASVPVISLGPDPSFWVSSTVDPQIVGTCHRYIANNGDENFINLLLYIRNAVLDEDLSFAPPAYVPWEGLYHPDAPQVFLEAADYHAWYATRAQSAAPSVGLLFSRTSWASGNVAIEDQLIRSLERAGLNVIPAFTYAIRDEALGAKGMDEVALAYFVREGKPVVDAIIKIVPFLLGSSRVTGSPGETAVNAGIAFFSSLDVPVFSPVVTNYLMV